MSLIETARPTKNNTEQSRPSRGTLDEQERPIHPKTGQFDFGEFDQAEFDRKRNYWYDWEREARP